MVVGAVELNVLPARDGLARVKSIMMATPRAKLSALRHATLGPGMPASVGAKCATRLATDHERGASLHRRVLGRLEALRCWVWHKVLPDDGLRRWQIVLLVLLVLMLADDTTGLRLVIRAGHRRQMTVGLDDVPRVRQLALDRLF